MTPSPEILAQYAALSQSVGIADLSDRTRLEILGADRAAFLHNFCTNDVKQLAPGRGCEAFITSHQGKTLGHVLIFCEKDRLLLETSPDQAKPLIAHFDKYLISEDVQFFDRSAEIGELLVAGPQASEKLSQAVGGGAPTEMLVTIAGTIAGRDVLVCRVEYAGPASFLVQAARADLPTVVDTFRQIGAVQCGSLAVEMRRLEAGFPLFGRDISDENLPQEVGRDTKAISFKKGCYLGQETVARLDAIGHVNRLLVGLTFAGTEVPTAGTPLQAAGKVVGQVTSAAWSPHLNAPLAMGYVRSIHAKAGTQLDSPLGRVTVTALPLNAS